MREVRDTSGKQEIKKAKQTLEEEEDTELMMKLVKASKECKARKSN